MFNTPDRCRRGRRLLGTALALALSLFNPAIAADGPGHASSAIAAELYAVRINGERLADPTLFVRTPDGALFVSLQTLQDWNITPPRTCGLVYDGAPFCKLDSQTVSRVSYDAKAREYAIVLAAGALSKTSVEVERRRPPAVIAGPEHAAFINYDVNALVGGSVFNGLPQTLSGLFESGLTTGGGILTTSAVAQTLDPTRPKFTMLGTTWQHSDPNHHTVTTFGDGITNGGALGAEFRFAGVAWSSNFDSDPRFVTSPTLSLAGVANVPSVLDLYVNNALTSSKNVPAGPFELNTMPSVDGAGQVRVVVRDLLGRQQVLTGSYYSTPNILRRGLDDFAFAAGVERLNYGYRSLQYGPFFIEGNERRGVTSRFTAELHAEFESAAQQAGLIGNWLLPKFGTVNAGVAASHGTLGHGASGLLGYSYQNEHLSFGGSVQTSSPAYQQVGEGGGDVAASRQTSLHVGLQNEQDSLSLAYAEQTQFGSYASKVVTLSLNHDLRHGDLELDALRTVSASGSSFGLNAVYHLTLGHRRSLNVETDRGSGSRDDRVEVSQLRAPGPFGNASRLQIDSGDTNAISGQLTHLGPDGSAVLTATAGANAFQFGTELKGGLAFVDHERYVTPRLLDAFGVVHVGYPNVRVFEDDQLVGRTNARGDIVVPNLSAYDSVDISIAKQDLPVGVVADNDDQRIVPAYREAASITFKTRRTAASVMTPVKLKSLAFVPLLPVRTAPAAANTAARAKAVLVRSDSPSPCRAAIASDAARIACTPYHVRAVERELNRLYALCARTYGNAKQHGPAARKEDCGDWARRNASVALDGTVQSKDAVPPAAPRLR